MDAPKAVRVVHYYDSRLRETLCGLRGFEERSTKHARGVTCAACVGLLHERLSADRSPAPAPSSAEESAANS